MNQLQKLVLPVRVLVVIVHSDNIPAEIESAKIVVLRVHLNRDSFHAHDVLLD